MSTSGSSSMRSAIRANLVTAMEAGCDDLMTCATADGRPLPLSRDRELPAESSSNRAVGDGG
jgi:hypothetical protein